MLHYRFITPIRRFTGHLSVHAWTVTLLFLILGFMADNAMAKKNLLFTSEYNLPTSLVNRIEESTDEMIWIATEDGLCRFDGSRFVTYYHQPGNSNSLQSNFIRTICTDDAGHVLVGTMSGVQMYRPETDDFTTIICDTLQGIPMGNVSDINRLLDGDFLVSGNTIFTIHIDENGEPHALPNVLTNTVKTSLRSCQDYCGNFWTTSSVHGVHRISKEGKMERIPLGNGIKGFNILKPGPDGNMYMGGVDRGLYKYDKVSKKIEEITQSGDNFRISALRNIPGKQQMYVCTDGSGVKILDCVTGTMTPFVFEESQMDSETQKVHSIVTSRNGDLWLALYQKGVFVISRNQFDFHYYGPHSLRYNCIGDWCVTTLMRTHDGMLWVGTDNGGIYSVDADGQTVVHHPCNTGPGPIPFALVTLFEDSRHRVWFGSFRQGGGILDLKTGFCQYIPVENQRSNAINIYSYAEDNRGDIWVGSMSNGILKYDEKRKTFVRQMVHPACNWTGVLCYNPATDQLYAGTSGGLVIISQLDKELQCEQFYPNLVIYSISRISATKISLSTNGGLVIFDTQKKRGKTYTTEDGLATNNAYASQVDGDDNIWISGPRGISKLNLRQETITNYTSSDGLQFNEFYRNATLRDRDGTLWFGGTQGINWFKPREIRKNESVVNVRVARFVSDRKRILPDKDGVYRLEEGNHTFMIELSARPIMQTYNVTYRYAVDNDDWQTLPHEVNRVTFSRINSGSHTFRFQIDAEGTLSPIESVSIYIPRPWYQTWWARLLGFAILASILWFIILYQRRRYREKKMRLEHAQEVAQKEEKLKFFMNIAHEIRTPMSLVVSPLQKLMNTDDDPERQHSYQLIDRNANRVLGLVNELMDLRKIDKEQMRLQCQQCSPAEMITSLCDTVMDLVEDRQLSLKFNNLLLEGFTTWIDKGCFEKIVINLLSNSIKYTPRGGQIFVEAALTPDKNLKVSVTDTGIGIDSEDKKHIFERFYRSEENSFHTIGTGIGLNLVKSLVTLHHGDIRVDDNPEGKGTVFEFVLPTRDDAYKADEKIAIPVKKDELEGEINDLTIMKKSVGKSLDETSDEAGRYFRRILVVDDDDEVRNYLALELRPTYRVTSCLNGREALEKLMEDANGYDLVLSDVMMPEMDGLQLCQYIRSNVRLNHLPVILLTAKSSDEDRLNSLEIGANAFISKPFNLEILRKTIKNLIEEHDRLRSSFSGLQLPTDRVDTPELQSPDHRLLQRIIKVVNDNLNNPELTGEMIADKVGVSRVHLYRKLKEMTNQTARNYVRNIRLAKAAELLTQRKMSIAEVAYEVGFSSPNNFATAFKEMYGMTPTAYNEKHYMGNEK